MAILVRRHTDTRADFSRHWRDVHGRMVAQLPKLRCYVQSHVIEDFLSRGERGAFQADGFVEQQYDCAEDMEKAYASPIVKEMLIDEPNYLGHATNYATMANAPVQPEPEGKKLVVVLRNGEDPRLVEALESGIRALPGCTGVIRDNVVQVIPKAGMPTGPQLVDAFLQGYFEDEERARQGGRRASESVKERAAGGAASVFRVATVQLV